jgi:hypothetical protein
VNIVVNKALEIALLKAGLNSTAVGIILLII